MAELIRLAEDPAEAVKSRLRGDLRTAMKARDGERVRLLRALIAALDNAQAPSATKRDDRYTVHAFEDRTAEVERLRLSLDEVRHLFEAEEATRRAAASELAQHGQVIPAHGLLREAEAIAALRAAL